MEREYDIIIIGGGVAGCEAAELAVDKGLKVALIERNLIGGTCLNCGCIPSKSYLAIAHNIELVNEKVLQKGCIGDIKYDFIEILNRQKSVVEDLRHGMENGLKVKGVDLLFGSPTVCKENDKVIVCLDDNILTAPYAILATGTKPKISCFEGIESEIANSFVYTNENIFCMKELPQSMIVIGGGVSGVEMAYAFSAFGSKVTILETCERILPNYDDDISDKVHNLLERKGINIIINVRVEEVCEGTVVFVDKLGEENILECDSVYLSVGREMVKMDYFTNEIAYDERGFVQVDENYMTCIKNVYAIGDICGKYMLAHNAMEQAQKVIKHITNVEILDMEKSMPQVLYISPECIQVGQNEKYLNENSIEYDKEVLSMNYSGRYVATIGEMSNDGIIKLIFDKDNVLIGAAMISNFASEVAMILQIMIQCKMNCEQIVSFMYPHPTECELIKKCTYNYMKRKGVVL